MATESIQSRAKAQALIRTRIRSGEPVAVEQIIWAFDRSEFARIAELAEINGVLFAGPKSERPAREAVLAVFGDGTTVAAGQAVHERADRKGRLVLGSTFLACDGERLAWARIKDPKTISQLRLADIQRAVVERERLILHVGGPANTDPDTIAFRFWSDVLRDSIRARVTPDRPDVG